MVCTEEILETNSRIKLISELVEIRKKKKISQRKLAELSGVRQPIIARIEKGRAVPNLDTVLKILASLDKTLAIVPLEEEKTD